VKFLCVSCDEPMKLTHANPPSAAHSRSCTDVRAVATNSRC